MTAYWFAPPASGGRVHSCGTTDLDFADTGAAHGDRGRPCLGTGSPPSRSELVVRDLPLGAK
jgi:hypothetical protein